MLAYLGLNTNYYNICSRVFTFGIGSGASTALVNGIAKAGRGTSEFIKEGERMQPKVCIYKYYTGTNNNLICSSMLQKGCNCR